MELWKLFLNFYIDIYKTNILFTAYMHMSKYPVIKITLLKKLTSTKLRMFRIVTILTLSIHFY